MAAIIPVPEEPVMGVTLALSTILVLILVLPFKVRVVEENLEYFFFAMGLVAVGVIYGLGLAGAEEIKEIFKLASRTPVMIGGMPIGITQVVLIAGLFFYFMGDRVYRGINRLLFKIGFPLFAFIIVVTLGLVSSIISVIVTAVILSEIISALPLKREQKIELAVIAAFAVGLGAALTPVGEPLSTIAVSKLSGPPYYADFTFLFRIIGHLVIPGVIVLGIYAWYKMRKYAPDPSLAGKTAPEAGGQSLRMVVERAVKVYLFVAALEMLGASFTPLIYWYLSKLPGWALYWINMVSAVLDNATLTAAEIAPFLDLLQIKSALMSLLISGGMLIPGNVPNIVLAGRLGIKSKEWARVGVPIGLVLLMVYFVLVEVLKL